jgi:hypothetical protein
MRTHNWQWQFRSQNILAAGVFQGKRGGARWRVNKGHTETYQSSWGFEIFFFMNYRFH